MAKGEKVNSISIDSLQYEMVSLNNYYGEQKVLMQSQLSESITGNQSRLDHFKNTMTDSEYVAINATLSRDKQLLQNLDSLSIHSDSSVRLYKAHYWLRAVTDKKTYTEPQLIYLSQKEMKPITKTTE